MDYLCGQWGTMLVDNVCVCVCVCVCAHACDEWRKQHRNCCCEVSLGIKTNMVLES